MVLSLSYIVLGCVLSRENYIQTNLEGATLLLVVLHHIERQCQGLSRNNIERVKQIITWSCRARLEAWRSSRAGQKILSILSINSSF